MSGSSSGSTRVEIYDTTLRDGTQGEGFNLSMEDKVQIACKLDEIGVDLVEGGFPLSNPKDAAFFREIRNAKLTRSRIAAFGMTRRRGIKAEEDPGMQSLLAAETPVVTLVGKSAKYQAEKVLGVTAEENLAMIGDSVRLMCSAGREVIYDAEHFFDAYSADKAYAIATLRSALDAGARVLCLCDTNGGSMPELVAEAVTAVHGEFGHETTVGVHTHNDAGVALANALAGYRAGARHVQGTINGVGERCGNMDLIPLIANLKLKYNADCLYDDSLHQLTEVARYVYETANLPLVSGQPYVGPSAFAHKGGMHVHAIQKDSTTYEHVSPEQVGNTRKVLVSELSGVSNIASKAGVRFDLNEDKATLRKVLQSVQELENEGFQFESAEASFELLVRKQIGRYRAFFELDHYRVIVLRTDAGTPVSEATLKLKVGGKVEHQVAEGDGPVNAIDAALRRALLPHFPRIAQVHLTDYKVRVINSREETAAKVRVVIECRRTAADGSRELFGTIGVSPNIIDASWQALTEAYEYHLLHAEEESEANPSAKTK